MVSPQPQQPAKPRTLRFVWFPIAIFILAATCILGLLLTPDEGEWFRAMTNSLIGLIIVFAGFWIGLWFLLVSGVRWSYRVAVVLVIIGVAASIRLEFSGDMLPIFSLRWAASPEADLEAYRESQSQKDLSWDASASSSAQTDFREYRGPRRDGVIEGLEFETDWGAHPPNLLWKHPVGGGYSSFAVAGDVAVTIEQRRDQEVVVAYDVPTGAEYWLHGYVASFEETMGGDGPRATPTIAGSMIYALGATGRLSCLEAETGDKVWSRNILHDAGAENLNWAMAGSPLVYGDVVVVNPGGGDGHSLAAYGKDSGDIVWRAGDAKAGYSSPMLATLCDRQVVVIFDGVGLAAYAPDGEGELFRFPWETTQDIHVAQPIVYSDNRIFISSGYGVGSAMLQVSRAESKWSVKKLWTTKRLRCKFTSPVAHEGAIYGLDEGVLVCLDEKTGKRRWKQGRYGHGQLLLVGDDLLILSERGDVVLVAANDAKFTEYGSVAVLKGKTWNNPALSGDRLLVRNHREMACLQLAVSTSP